MNSLDQGLRINSRKGNYRQSSNIAGIGNVKNQKSRHLKYYKSVLIFNNSNPR